MKHDRAVSGATFSKDEQRIVTWSSDGTARLWDANDGAPLGQPMKNDLRFSGATFSKDDQQILTWSRDGTARLWDIHADYDFPPDLLPLLIQILTGTAMDDFGNLRVLNPHNWTETKKTYIQLAEKHLQTCKYESVNLYKTQKAPWGNEEKQGAQGN